MSQETPPQPGLPVSPAQPTARMRAVWTAGGLLLVVALWTASDVVLAAFAAVLVAVFLRGAGDWIALVLHMSRGAGLALLTFVILLVLVVLSMTVASEVITELEYASQRLPAALDQVRVWLEQQPLGAWMALQARDVPSFQNPSRMLAQVGGLFSSLVGVVSLVVIVAIAGLFIAAESHRYREGFIRSFPLMRRDRMREVLQASGHAIRGWLLGQLVSMLVLGIFSYVGLRLLGIPLALVLSLFTALLTFIPTLGPLISVVPPLVLALAEGGPGRAAWVALFYLVLQNLEGYFITPMVQRSAARLPPAMLLFVQLFAVVMLGFLGLVVAAPLLAALLPAYRMLYLEDVLGEPREGPQNASGRASS